ncbi:MAG: RNase P modulator RnpM [Bacilli bacterium]
MKIKKVPQRTCVVTREKTDKMNLLRIVRTKENGIVIDETGKLNGRGCYIKKDIEVVKKAMKGKHINRALESEVPESLYEEIIKIIEK